MVARIVRFTPVLVLLLLGIRGIPQAHAALITSFQGAFQSPAPATGWSYLWNNAGPIGNPANYTPLLAMPGGGYSSDGTIVFPAAPPAGFINFALAGNPLVPGGHPGLGTNDVGSGGIERYAIAAFTLASADSISIQNGLLKNLNPNMGGSPDGLNLKIYVNNSSTPVISDATAPGVGSQITFAAPLGSLGAGDKIYVAIGGRDSAGFDTFALQYDIVSVPEPTGLSLLAIAAALGTIIAEHRYRRGHRC